MQIMRAGRARWRIENETFNMLKNQGYHFEHNFGHSHKYLSSVFGALMLPGFLIDQIEARCDEFFGVALEKMKRLKYFKENVWTLCVVHSGELGVVVLSDREEIQGLHID